MLFCRACNQKTVSTWTNYQNLCVARRILVTLEGATLHDNMYTGTDVRISRNLKFTEGIVGNAGTVGDNVYPRHCARIAK